MISNGGGAGRDGGVAGSNGGGGVILKKGPWSAGEDAVLIEYVKKQGEGNWNAVQRNTGLQRCGKSCRLRWANHLRPNLKKGAFSPDEERLIIDLHSKLGNKWARISAHLPGRTDNEIKNYWNTRVKRRLRQGLPLYPNHLSLQSPPPPPPPPTATTAATLSLFDPVSLSSALFSLHHPPPFLSPHPLNCPDPFPDRPISSPSQLGHLCLGPTSFGLNPGLTRFEAHDSGMGQVGSGFDSVNFELPSNQFFQKVTNDEVQDEMKINNPNVGRCNSGLLDDLLQEAQAKVGGSKSTQWDSLSPENSCTEGIKKEESEEQQFCSMNEDLSNILELIPSLVQVPAWCKDGGGESSVGQSSVVSTDDNYNELDDQLPLLPSFRDYDDDDVDDDDDDEGDWKTGCYAWDNLPRIC